MIYDSQTDWTLVQAKSCMTCAQGIQRYDNTKSTTRTQSDIATTVVLFGTGGTLTGVASNDIACLVTTV